MNTLLNEHRPPLFCPGCSHELVVHGLDKAFVRLGWQGHQIVIVTDIGCSGLFDTFFNTHTFHGLHGRALTYAVGIKMARPQLHVVVTMGDGGIGIGAAHVLNACRRNIDITLLVLNNFNFGMTGGQCSPTTPADMNTGSGFINQLEKPIDICRFVASAGAQYATSLSVYQKDLPEKIADALQFCGFSVMDLRGTCTGRLARRNKLSPKTLRMSTGQNDAIPHSNAVGDPLDYAALYQKLAARQPPAPAPISVKKKFKPIISNRQEVLILGRAGQHIITAGEIICLAGLTSGLHVTCKTDYPVTVLRGHSICEVVLSPEKIGFTGIVSPTVIIGLSQEGIEKRRTFIEKLEAPPFIIVAAGREIPDSKGRIETLDFNAIGIKPADWALAALGALPAFSCCITTSMLHVALSIRFHSEARRLSLAVVDKIYRYVCENKP